MKARPTQSRGGVKGEIPPCRVKGQRPLWGLGQRPNCSASNQSQGSRQQRRRQRSVPASNFARPQTRPQAALPSRFRDEPEFFILSNTNETQRYAKWNEWTPESKRRKQMVQANLEIVSYASLFPESQRGCERKFAHSLLLFSCDLRMNIASETENGYFTAFTSATQAS